MSDPYTPRPEHKFSFGLWTVGNRGRDPFGDAVRDPLPPLDAVALLAEVGAWGVNLHDNDLVPIDATSRRARSHRHGRSRTPAAITASSCRWRPSTCSIDPVFRDGAFTANDARVRAYALQKTMRAMDLGAELGAGDLRAVGRTRGNGNRCLPRPDEAIKRLREAVNYLCEYSIDRKYGFKFALEAKPNEPRGDIYMATTGAYLGFIPTLDHPEMVGVNPEVAHEQMAGLNFLHAVAQAWEAGKLFHIDLERPGAGTLRSGLPVRIREREGGVLAGEVPRGRRLRRSAALRRARLPHGRLRRRPRLRARMHADVFDPA